MDVSLIHLATFSSLTMHDPFSLYNLLVVINKLHQHQHSFKFLHCQLSYLPASTFLADITWSYFLILILVE